MRVEKWFWFRHSDHSEIQNSGFGNQSHFGVAALKDLKSGALREIEIVKCNLVLKKNCYLFDAEFTLIKLRSEEEKRKEKKKEAECH
jgi:hypothetical protein